MSRTCEGQSSLMPNGQVEPESRQFVSRKHLGMAVLILRFWHSRLILLVN